MSRAGVIVRYLGIIEAREYLMSKGLTAKQANQVILELLRTRP